MCDYCEKEKVIIEKEEFIDCDVWEHGWESEYTLSVFIDRGHLRLVDLISDGQGLDHGEKIEIKYCPFCGLELNKNNK